MLLLVTTVSKLKPRSALRQFSVLKFQLPRFVVLSSGLHLFLNTTLILIRVLILIPIIIFLFLFILLLILSLIFIHSFAHLSVFPSLGIDFSSLIECIERRRPRDSMLERSALSGSGSEFEFRFELESKYECEFGSRSKSDSDSGSDCGSKCGFRFKFESLR